MSKVKQADINILDIPTLKGIVTNRSSNNEMRCRAIKALGRLASVEALDFITNLILDVDGEINRNTHSIVRREAVSAIGRIKSVDTIKVLVNILHKEYDPKVVCQILRALRRFRQLKGFADYTGYITTELVQTAYCFDDRTIKELALLPSKRRSRKVDITDVMPHPFVLDELKNLVIKGDSSTELTKLPDGCLHLTFTSPPYYNARDYSIYSSYEEYLGQLCKVFKEVMRVTKEGRFLVVNTSPVIMPRISRAHQSKRYPITFDLHARLVAMGWEFVDDIIWEKPEFSVKNRNGQFAQHRKPLTYKPNNVTEYLMVYRKPTSRLIDWNIRSYDKDVVDESKILGHYDTTNIWKIQPIASKKHSAVFPIELCERVIRYYSFKGDLVLDPFAGTGTVALAAEKLGRKFMMVEVNDDFTKVICDNLKDKDVEFQTRNID